MTVAVKLSTDVRWVRTFRGPESLADDLGILGSWVGPRTGRDKRTKDQKEDYVLRRLLVAWKVTGRLSLPVEISASTDGQGEPDFVLAWQDGQTLGIEVTEAGGEDHQKWLTGSEDARAAGHMLVVPSDASTTRTASEIRDAIRAKVDKFDSGSYRAPQACDLIVYDNTAWGGYLDKNELLQILGRPNDLLGRFRQIHFLTGQTAFLDLFGPEFAKVDVSKTYEIDYAAWTFDQVEKLREGSTDRLDLVNIAEELESLGKSERRTVRSHVRNLIAHLLKWIYQPEKRSASWLRTIDNSRGEIEDAIADSPSLGSEDFLLDAVQDQYPKARRRALREAKLTPDVLPKECPFTLEQLFDPDYPPVGEKEPPHS